MQRALCKKEWGCSCVVVHVHNVNRDLYFASGSRSSFGEILLGRPLAPFVLIVYIIFKHVPPHSRSSLTETRTPPPLARRRSPSTMAPASMAATSAPSSPSPNPTSQPEELVQVDTALAVLSKVNLLAESTALALDIGGSLAKIIYLQPFGTRHSTVPLLIHRVDGNVASALSVSVPELNGVLHFFAFETRNIHQLLRFIRTHWANESHPSTSAHTLIRATGGGSYKYASNFVDEIGVTLARLDEMSCTVAGLNFLLTTVKEEVYEYIPPHKQPAHTIAPPDSVHEPTQDFARKFVDTTRHPFPYLLVNIGSGVSIVKVTGHGQFERVSGSSLGGGTFWGLARMLLDCATFDDVIRLTHDGDNANVDMLVGDIYGGAYSNLGLDSSIIAASFGKATMRNDPPELPNFSWHTLKDRFSRAVKGSFDLWMSFFEAVPCIGDILRTLMPARSPCAPVTATDLSANFRQQDIALSLLRMVSYNIGQIAYLNARVHNLDRIYFGGNFIRNHPYTIADISFAVDFWSEESMKALFLRHDGYLGAIGAFIGASSDAPTKIFKSQKHSTTPSSDTRHSANGTREKNKPSSQLANGKTKDAMPLVGDLVLTKPALAEDTSPSKPRNGMVEVPNGTAKRKKGKRTKSEDGARALTSPMANGNLTKTVQGSRDSSATGDQKVSASGGDWTTVTRTRRKSASKEKLS